MHQILSNFINFLAIVNFGFVPLADFELKFKILILAFLNLNLNLKLQNFNITVTYDGGTKVSKHYLTVGCTDRSLSIILSLVTFQFELEKVSVFEFLCRTDFELKFKILILAFLNLNLNLKLQNFNITVTYDGGTKSFETLFDSRLHRSLPVHHFIACYFSI